MKRSLLSLPVTVGFYKQFRRILETIQRFHLYPNVKLLFIHLFMGSFIHSFILQVLIVWLQRIKHCAGLLGLWDKQKHWPLLSQIWQQSEGEKYEANNHACKWTPTNWDRCPGEKQRLSRATPQHTHTSRPGCICLTMCQHRCALDKANIWEVREAVHWAKVGSGVCISL